MKAADRQRLENELETAREWLAISERDLGRLANRRYGRNTAEVSSAQRRVFQNRKRVEELEARIAELDGSTP